MSHSQQHSGAQFTFLISSWRRRRQQNLVFKRTDPTASKHQPKLVLLKAYFLTLNVNEDVDDDEDDELKRVIR